MKHSDHPDPHPLPPVPPESQDPDTTARSTCVDAQLADYLSEHKEQMLGEWRDRVHEDSSITSSKSLTTVALVNRLPYIYDDLNATLRRFRSSPIAEQSVRDAKEHGATRWRQGYELSEVLRELKHLRSLLVYHLRTFESAHPDNGTAAMLFVSTLVHRFLDEMVIDATEEFVSFQLGLKDEMHRRKEQKWREESAAAKQA